MRGAWVALVDRVEDCSTDTLRCDVGFVIIEEEGCNVDRIADSGCRKLVGKEVEVLRGLGQCRGE